MVYRNWSIKAYSSYLGFFVQYVSPTGQAHNTSACFTTEDQAVSFARSRVDYLLDVELLRFAKPSRFTDTHAGHPTLSA